MGCQALAMDVGRDVQRVRYMAVRIVFQQLASLCQSYCRQLASAG